MAQILLVDDEPDVRKALAAFLRSCGHEVRVVGSGIQALAALREAAADVVVTDINMPDMDGIEIVVALREASSEVGVIAISGGGMLDKALLLDSAAALGADVTLEKPMDLDELRSAIDTLVARRLERGSGP